MSTGFSFNDAMTVLNVQPTDVVKVNKILSRISGSKFKRQNPYNLDHPIQSYRYFGLKNLDEKISI
jgi:hypothetical protein